MAEGNGTHEAGERLEDIFQDEIIPRIAKMSDFIKFARSKDGLSLRELDIEHILHDHREAAERKMQLLFRWKFVNGANATVARIRETVEKYLLKLMPDDEPAEDEILNDQRNPAGTRPGDVADGNGQHMLCNDDYNVALTHGAHLAVGFVNEHMEAPNAKGFNDELEKGVLQSQMGNITDAFNILQLEGEAWHLTASSKYTEALAVLSQLLHLQIQPLRKLHALLLTVECDIMCNNHHSVVKTIDKIVGLMTSSVTSCNDIIELGQKYERQEKYIRAFVLYNSACKLSRMKNGDVGSDDVVMVIAGCARYTRDIASALCDKGLERVVADHVIPSLNDALEELSCLTCKQTKVQAVQRAWVMHHISFCYGFCNQDEKADSLNQDAIDLMEKELGVQAKHYRLYGLCLHHAGTAYYEAKHNRLATKMWTSALSAFEHATDWKSIQQKKKMDRTAKCLKLLK